MVNIIFYFFIRCMRCNPSNRCAFAYLYFLQALSDHQNAEQTDYLAQIQTLQKEITCLSSSSLAREKESLRKDLEKTKGKLKESEVKLKNSLQEKTKLEV